MEAEFRQAEADRHPRPQDLRQHLRIEGEVVGVRPKRQAVLEPPYIVASKPCVDDLRFPPVSKIEKTGLTYFLYF